MPTNQHRKTKSYKIALGAMLTSLCILLMFLTGIFPFATYSIPAVAGILMVPIVIEISIKWAFLVYGCISLLSLFIAPDKEAAILFVLFFGYYPIIKALLERMRSQVIEWVLKIIIFNAAIVGSYCLMIFGFRLPNILQEFGEFSPLFISGLLLLGNVTFIVFDIACSRVIAAYIHWLRPKLLKRL